MGVRPASLACRGANVVIAVDPAGCLGFALSSHVAFQRPLQPPVAPGPALEQELS